jgi:hypothetical protein
LVGNPKEIPLQKLDFRWKNNINAGLKGYEGVALSHVAQDGVQWEVFAYTVMKLFVPKEAGIRPGERLTVSQEEFCFMQLIPHSLTVSVSYLGAGPHTSQTG